MKQAKQILAAAVLGAGLGMLFYGFGFHALPVYSEDNDKGFATRETSIIREVSIGGLKRDIDGELHKTYTGKPPEACPT